MMNKNNSAGIIKDLFTLANEKLSCLQALKNNLQLFYNTMETADHKEILSRLEKEADCRKQIMEIDQRYERLKDSLFHNDPVLFSALSQKNKANLPQEVMALYDILKEQREILQELVDLNEITQCKAQNLHASYKEKIQDILRQKNMVADYVSHQQKGSLFDYKERENR